MSQVIVPITGEIVDLSDQATDRIAEELNEISAFEQDVRSFKRAANEELATRLDHEGRRSADVGEWHLEANAPTERVWDVPELQRALLLAVCEELISGEKATRCIRQEPKVVWSEVKTLLSDPRLKRLLEPCYTDVPTSRYVRVRHGR
jgi:hypothetical protein